MAGPLLGAFTVWALPEGYTDAQGAWVPLASGARVTLAVAAWMAVWWLTEAVEVYATALLPVALLPLLGGASLEDATRPYADKLIFLFLGGFWLAGAMQRCGLDRRLALATLRRVSPRPPQIVAGTMAATAFLSMFVSNTATAVVMLPIALRVADLVGAGADSGDPLLRRRFAPCLMLSVAYAATLGGVATKIGTPPNGLLLAFLEQSYGRPVDFVTWLGVGLPLAGIFLPLCWLTLTRFLYPLPRTPLAGARETLARAAAELGPPSRAERTTAAVFAVTAGAWVLRPWIAHGAPALGLPALVPGLSDAGISMLCALSLFVLPGQRRPWRPVLDWATARQAPWGVLILFGGGLSLAAAIRAQGLDAYFGSLAASLGPLPAPVLVAVTATVVMGLTELTSNTATTATLLPILGGVAPALGVDPTLLLVPAALAASCAFMLPVATPPNAVVFASGHLTIPEMARAGIWMNALGVVLVTGVTLTLVPWVLGP